NMGEDKKSGWWWPGSAGKAHYMHEDSGRSLCMKWLTFAPVSLEQGNDGSPDNCVVCKRRLAAMSAEAQGTG
ncbi:hypothetical protein LCGC14_2577550, partial [marine sediment metagenome]